MSWGMKNRLARVIKPDGRCFFLAIDHGYFQGPTSCLEKPGERIAPLLPYADAVFVTRGVLRNCFDPAAMPPVILRVSGGSTMVGRDLACEKVTTSIEEVLRLNAAAVGISVFVGSDYEFQTLTAMAELIDRCESYSIPVMAVTAVGREMDKRDVRYLGLACRVAAELGARVVKTYWCENFEKIVEGCPVPVVIAGGPMCETEKEVFEFVHDGIQRGAIGVNLGRNVWKHDHPVPMMRALRGVIHDNLTPDEADDLFGQLISEETKQKKNG